MQRSLDEGSKFCRECELLLFNKCLEIHKIFNESHNLEEKEAPLKEICEAYTEYTE